MDVRFIDEWRQAYREVHNTDVAPPIVGRGAGWFVILDGGSHKPRRRREIEAMTARLRKWIAENVPA